MVLFPEEHAGLLKEWIVGRIENTSDADSDVLAEYVIALLRHDGDEPTIRALCEQEIPDFLDEDPKAFLDDVFEAIKNKAYLPAQRPPPESAPSHQLPPTLAQPGAVVTKKRAFDDQADGPGPVQQGGPQPPRSNKQARRGGRRPVDDVANLHAGRAAINLPLPPQPPPGMPPFDPSNPMDTIMQLQAMGIPFPAFPTFPQPSFDARTPRNQARKRGRCRDYDTKGYCSRGSTCMYDHGQESIYVPPTLPQTEEYDPHNAAMGITGALNQSPFAFAFNPDLNRGRGRKSRASQRGGRKGGARAPFSADGPVLDRSKSTIVVENIPEESFSDQQVRGFFSQFGSITDVNLQPYKHLAVVKFDSWAAANDAYRSPKVIFDNRFVKVFWYKDESDAQTVPGTPQKGTSGVDSSAPWTQEDGGADEFRKKQEEAQKQHEEREAKKVELERQRQLLEQQQQELVAKHQAEKERLKAKLTNKGQDDSTASSDTDFLRAQLAALEQEAMRLGIDPNAADDGSGHRGGSRGRGGYRGRSGRGRGRGTLRGHEARHAAYAQYSIDNRPRKVALSGADFTPAAMDEKLRHFLLNLGDFESVETGPVVTHVTFPDRKTAEKFYYSLHGKQLPGVEAKLEISWANAAPLSKRSSDEGDDDAQLGRDDDDVGRAQGQEQPQRHVDMDYEAGDDEGWADGIQ
ncbi:hypothetical protein CDD81_5932 [Ophiocordyceps australis]|uniref:C3H1-type domain-containing protein n=1 Tax=Ophiocordyceps australis TaxID=1399860 RepID=A0A2C5YH54_9HYPO|nr:hypothetical protein CDD81_5932 [Ophiocordyceps australis]